MLFYFVLSIFRVFVINFFILKPVWFQLVRVRYALYWALVPQELEPTGEFGVSLIASKLSG
jgi:hypothetical protein